jgi:hypothetical protein
MYSFFARVGHPDIRWSIVSSYIIIIIIIIIIMLLLLLLRLRIWIVKQPVGPVCAAWVVPRCETLPQRARALNTVRGGKSAICSQPLTVVLKGKLYRTPLIVTDMWQR